MYAFDPESGIGTIDCHYVKPLLACAYIMVEGDDAAFIENNTSLALPHLMAALEELGLRREQVKYAIITHVHLDHAGGSGALLRECPNATLLAHPKAARHIIDPARLIASSIEVYGEDAFRQLYGEIIPVPEGRVRIMEDGESLSLGSRTLHFLHTRGHANHHFCIHDSKSNGVFTGDSFGIAYPAVQKGKAFIYPTSTPTDFDPVEARKTVSRIRETGCSRLFLTHFGEFTALDEGEAQMRDGLDFLEGIMDDAWRSLQPADVLKAEFARKILARMESEASRLSIDVSADAHEMLALDANLNAQGLVIAVERKRRAAGESR